MTAGSTLGPGGGVRQRQDHPDPRHRRAAHAPLGSHDYQGAALPGTVEERTTRQRREIQYVFQNPDASLNPRQRVTDIIGRPL